MAPKRLQLKPNGKKDTAKKAPFVGKNQKAKEVDSKKTDEELLIAKKKEEVESLVKQIKDLIETLRTGPERLNEMMDRLGVLRGKVGAKEEDDDNDAEGDL